MLFCVKGSGDFLAASVVLVQVNEIKASVKFQLKKVLCLGVAIGNVAMEDKEIYVNTQVSWALQG